MTLGDLKEGDFFVFLEEAPPKGCDQAPQGELIQVSAMPAEDWDGAARCFQLTGEDRGTADWLLERRVEKISPCKSCLDENTDWEGSYCPCWLKE